MKMKSILVSVLLCVSFVFLSSCQKGSESEGEQCLVIKPVFYAPAKAQKSYTDKTQYELLVDFFESTNGGGWKNNENWCNADKAFHEWFGVNTKTFDDVDYEDTADNVYSISFLRNSIHGYLPESIGYLEHLHYVSIEGYYNLNALESVIPESIGKLKNLRVLRLSRNKLKGPLPESIGDLSDLEELCLLFNRIKGEIPESMTRLSALKRMDLSDNTLDGPIPRNIGKLVNLKVLNLSRNYLTGPIPESIGDLKNLVALKLFSNKLSGPLPENIGRLTNLKTLILSRNQLSGPVPKSILNLKGLYYLDIRENRLWSDDPEVIAFLDEKCPGWEETQTLPPKNIRVEKVTNTSVRVSWEPVRDQADRGYFIVNYGRSSGKYEESVKTEDKQITSVVIEDLKPGKQYFFSVQNYTAPFVMSERQYRDFSIVEKNSERLSDYSEEISLKL